MRCISVNAFGILANCWTVFRKPFPLELKKSRQLHLLCLHFTIGLVNHEDPETGEIIEEFWRKEIPTESWKSLSNTRARNSAIEAKHIREEFMDYFTNEGCILWQWKCTKIDI